MTNHIPPSKVRESIASFRQELLKHVDLYIAAFNQNSFADCLGAVAAKLNIALDGDYDPVDLMDMLVRAMKARPENRVEAPQLAELQQVQLVETEGEISLLPEKDVDWQKEFAHKKDNAGELPPYTVCMKCKTEFDCCVERSCQQGCEVEQLGWPEGHKGFIQH